MLLTDLSQYTNSIISHVPIRYSTMARPCHTLPTSFPILKVTMQLVLLFSLYQLLSTICYSRSWLHGNQCHYYSSQDARNQYLLVPMTPTLLTTMATDKASINIKLCQCHHQTTKHTTAHHPSQRCGFLHHMRDRETDRGTDKQRDKQRQGGRDSKLNRINTYLKRNTCITCTCSQFKKLC